jgi:hypothetical protein
MYAKYVAILMSASASVGVADTIFYLQNFDNLANGAITRIPGWSFEKGDSEVKIFEDQLRGKVLCISRTDSLSQTYLAYSNIPHDFPLIVSAYVNVSDVRRSTAPWGGGQFHLRYFVNGKEQIRKDTMVPLVGTFTWQRVEFKIDSMPERIKGASLRIGFQEGAGKICFDDIQIRRDYEAGL